MDTISIWMTTEDAEIVQRIYDRTDLPDFTVVKRVDMGGEYNLSQLEIAVESSMNVWHLAKLVHIENQFNQQMADAKERITKIIEEGFKKIDDAKNI